MTKRLNKALSAFLIIVILATIGAIIYIVNTSNPHEKFTEFYILGMDGKADNYPKQVKLEENAQVIVGIVNHEQQAMTYRMDVLIDDAKDEAYNPIMLAAEAKWEQQVNIIPTKVGANQKVLFNLYKGDDAQPYLQLNLWIDVY